jgi:ribosomal protein S12 methylthiotransferase
MQRNITQKETYQLIENLRTAIPEAALRTTIITGFPGETEQNFQELLHFIRDIRFDRLGVFIYSPEEDTHAFRLKDDVPEKIKMERADEIMRLQQQISLSLNTGKIGREYKVLFDRTENNILVGRTEFDSPEVDNEVLVENGFQKASPGSFAQVKITSADDFDLFGQII